MSPPEKWPLVVPFMVAHGWTGTRRPPLGTRWTRWAALLLVALISALQNPVQGSPTLLPDVTSELWPSEELTSSSVTSEVVTTIEQSEEMENSTLYNNTTLSSKNSNTSDTSPTSSIQDNITMQLGELNPSESSPLSSFQPTNSGLSDSNTFTLLTLPLHPSSPYTSSASGADSLTPFPSSSSSSSSSSSLSLSTISSNQFFISSTDVDDTSSTVAPYSSMVPLGNSTGGNLNQDVVTDVIKSTPMVTGKTLTIETTSLEKMEIEISTFEATKFSVQESFTQTPHSSTLKTTAISNIESNNDSLTTSYKLSIPFTSTFTLSLDTLDTNNSKSYGAETFSFTQSTSTVMSTSTDHVDFMDGGSSDNQTSNSTSYPSTSFIPSFTDETTEVLNVTNNPPSDQYATIYNAYKTTDIGLRESLATDEIIVSPAIITINNSSNTNSPVSNNSAYMVSQTTSSPSTQHTETSISSKSNAMALSTVELEAISGSAPTNVLALTSESTRAIGDTKSEVAMTSIMTSMNPELNSPSPLQLHTTIESDTDLHMSSNAPLENDENSSRLSPTMQSRTSTQISPEFITTISYFYIDTVSNTKNSEHSTEKALSVETTTSGIGLSSSSNELGYTITDITSLSQPNTSTILFSSQSIADEMTTEAYLSNEIATYNTGTNTDKILNNFTEILLTNTTKIQNISEENTISSSIQTEPNTSASNIPLEVTISYSEELTSHLSIQSSTIVPSVAPVETLTQHAPSATSNVITSWTKSSTLTVNGSENTEILQTNFTEDTIHIVTDNPNISEKSTAISSTFKSFTSNALSTFHESTSNLDSSIEPSTIRSLSKTTSVETTLSTPSETSKYMTSWTSETSSVLSPPVINTSTTLYSQSNATSTLETPSESSMSTMMYRTNINTDSLQTYSTGEISQTVTYSPNINQENTTFMSTMTEYGSTNSKATLDESTSDLGITTKPNQTTVTTRSEDITSSNVITTRTITHNNTTVTNVTSPSVLNSTIILFSSQPTVTSAPETLMSTWTSSAPYEMNTNTESLQTNSFGHSSYTTTNSRSTNTESRTSTSFLSSDFPSSYSETTVISEATISLEERTGTMVSTPSNTVLIIDNSTTSSAITLLAALTASTILFSSQSSSTIAGETPTGMHISNGTITVIYNPDTNTEHLQTGEISSHQSVSSGITTALFPKMSESVVSITDYVDSTTHFTPHSEAMTSSSNQSTDQLRASTVPSISFSESTNQTSQETSQSAEISSTINSILSQPTSEKQLDSTSTVYTDLQSQSTTPYTLPFTTHSEIPSARPLTSKISPAMTTVSNATNIQQTVTGESNISTYLGSTTQADYSVTITVGSTNGSSTHKAVTSDSILQTISHLSSTSITPTHSSSLAHTTTIFPMNISNSLSTVSSMVSSAEVSTVSTAGIATQTFTSIPTPSSSYVTHTNHTSHISPSIINILVSTKLTKATQAPTSGELTAQTTHFIPTNHTAHTPTIVVLPTTVKTSIVTRTPSITTHASSTSTIKAMSDTSKTSTVLPQTITTPTMATTTASMTTTVTSVAPLTNATSTHSTNPTTIFSTSITPSLECKLSSNTMIKSVLTLVYQPTITQRETVVQNFADFLNHTLYQALKQPIQVFVNWTLVDMASLSRNVSVGYSVAVNFSVYIPSAIVDILTGSDVFNVPDLKLRIPILQSVPVIAQTWVLVPNSLQLKTVLKLMGTGGNVHTCVYARTMEQRLQTAFEKAENTSVGTSSNSLTVQILNTSEVNQILTLIYAVSNNSQPLNGTTASRLLNVLSGELVGYYLGDPPITIAEPLEFLNIDISAATRNYWLTTVIQGVDSQLLGVNNQSFAQQMEERLATLFQLSGQQSRRFRRATTVGSYTVQMVKMQRLTGANNLAELTYYAEKNGQPILGTAAAKQLSTIDQQTMALTLGYIVRIQANPVVQNPPNNLWIIAAVLAPIAVVTVIIIIITAVLCRKNKSDFKTDNMSNIPPRTKPVQGFDYAKQHLGQQGGDEDVLPVTQETVVPSLNLSQERDSTKDGSTEKMLKSSDNRNSRSPCENGSVISNESEEESSDRSTPQKVIAQHRVTKDDACKRNVPISDEDERNIHFDKNNKLVPDPFDSSSGSVQLIAIKPVSIPPSLAVSERNQEMSIINGEVNKALKQKSDIEHYRNKLRLKAKRKGYYDFPPIETKSLNERKRKAYEKTQAEIDNALEVDTDNSSPFAEPKNRQPIKNHAYRSRQSLNSPSPGETEMDLLVTRERPRRGIRNSGYDTEPEVIEETNIDRVKQARTFLKSRQAKGHSETSTLSSQPSIDEVRQQMHLLLEEAFSLASAGHGANKQQTDPYASAQHMPYSDVVTSAPGTMSRPRIQWVPTYGPEMYQYSLPRPTYRFSQLPEMGTGSPPPPVPPRTGPVAVPSLRRSTSDVNKNRMPEPSGNEQGPGNSVPAVFAIPGNRAGYSGYYIPQPPASYRNQAWMSYPGENELPGQWADSVPLPGYIEAYPRSRYPQVSPSRLPRQFGQPVNIHSSLDHAAGPSIGASQQSLTDTDTPDASITNLSTAALVKAIREEVAKLAKKQTDMFEFQV
ncbi:UPF0606 protein KIAA1549L homolog isoform X2 [Pseudophryne corroboree]|uniref:UPF0606 protein KIAA1549L homolog isoform X2 n=1 Tax=Pseudophryne corroboree TaxID=495146 RepID=UPI00308165B1